MDKVHNHIVKDNLKITRNNKLRKPFFESPKYRENRIIDYQKAKESIISPINSCIQSWCDKHDITIPSLSEWKQAMLAIDEKFNHLTTKLTPEKLHRIKKNK